MGDRSRSSSQRDWLIESLRIEAPKLSESECERKSTLYRTNICAGIACKRLRVFTRMVLSVRVTKTESGSLGA